jgi:putative membrane protein
MNMQKHRIASAAAVSGIVLAPAWVWAQQSPEASRYGYGPHMMDWGGGWFGMIFGPIVMILVLAAVIALAVLLVRWLGGPWHGMQPPPPVQPWRTPLDILKERYARGEINKEEFEECRRVLGD